MGLKQGSTHAKCNGCSNDLHFVMRPVVLRSLALLSRHHCMIRPARHTALRSEVSQTWAKAQLDSQQRLPDFGAEAACAPSEGFLHNSSTPQCKHNLVC